MTIILIVFAFGSAAALFHSAPIGGLAALALFGFIADSVVPSTFHIDANGVRVLSLGITRLEMPWREVRCVLSCPRGLKLSPFENPTGAYMDEMRGIRLTYTANQAQQVESLVFFYRKRMLEENIK